MTSPDSDDSGDEELPPLSPAAATPVAEPTPPPVIVDQPPAPASAPAQVKPPSPTKALEVLNGNHDSIILGVIFGGQSLTALTFSIPHSTLLEQYLLSY
jgi:hypothetical protein